MVFFYYYYNTLLIVATLTHDTLPMIHNPLPMTLLGLGSNLGDRIAYLRAAVDELALLLGELRLSRVFESKAMLPPGAANDSAPPYLNMAVAGSCALSPHELLAHVKAIEKKLGRVPRGFWAAREIDIDILAMGDVVVASPEINIPHYGITSRDFVMLPLMDIAPDWRYPAMGEWYGKTVAEIVKKLDFRLGEGLAVYD